MQEGLWLSRSERVCLALPMLQASMLEIYNEEYKDLLAKRPAKGAEPKKHNVVHDLPAGERCPTLHCTALHTLQPHAVVRVRAGTAGAEAEGCSWLPDMHCLHAR